MDITKTSFVNSDQIIQRMDEYRSAHPFNHCVIDNFLNPEIAATVEDEFLDYSSEKWFCYKNALEEKKALNDWNSFPPCTYALFQELSSPSFISHLETIVGQKLYADPGLHGGGWHIHGPGGNLNPHLDYSLHPKLGLQRKLNIIIYVSRKMEDHHGGHFGLWSCDSEGQPDRLVKEVAPQFNRAVIFDTTQNSWHGMSNALTQPEGIYRKSLAIYYLCDPGPNVDARSRALYAPREEQKGNSEIMDLIKRRSDSQHVSSTYRTSLGK